MKNNLLTGREKEVKILEAALTSNKPEMVSVVGRRRVGKTFLVKTIYENQIDFEITGVQHADREEQLLNFAIQISNYSKGNFPAIPAKNWIEAFHLLTKMLEAKKKKEKLVVFLDELPWLSTHRSGFLKGLSFFWNSWAVNQHIVVVVCGSAASWMIKNVVHHKGGLHNRITRRLNLQPFTLAETEAFLQAKNFNFDRYQIVQLYMVLGGVPHYLEEIEGGKSATQNIDKICFSTGGLLTDEFNKLYYALFDEADNHIEVIRAMATKRKGLTRNELANATSLSPGGGLTKILEELMYSGFVSRFLPFGKKQKDSLYRLTDEYSLFYLKFIEQNQSIDEQIWLQLSQTQSYTSWAGYTYESICLKHIPEIKKALGIHGIFSTTSSFFKKGTEDEEGVQVDMLIDRQDHSINLCEIKFHNAPLSIDKTTAMALRSKVARFKLSSKTSKHIFLTLITTFGLEQNQHSIGLIDTVLDMDDLFE